VYPACQMAAKTEPPEPSRDERLAAALRENLKRRKAQARAQNDIQQGSANKPAKEKPPSR
jgi:hypothetical protein